MLAVALECSLLNRLGLRVVGVDNADERTQADTRHHGERNLVDHVTRMTSDDSRTEHPIGAFFDVDLDEAGVLAVGDGAIDIVHRDRESLHWNTLSIRLAHVQAYMGDFGIGERAPRNDLLTPAFAPAL